MKLFIAGEWTDSTSGEVFDVVNPATGRVVDSAPKGTREDTRRAVDAAKVAFKRWSVTSPTDRTRVLYKLAEAVRRNKELLGKLLTQEQGKPLRESVLEIESFANTCGYYAGLATTLHGTSLIIASGKVHADIIKVPVGVVGAIIPWNFPISLLGWKLAPALAAGNTIVVKPASNTPLTDLKIGELADEADVPHGVINIVSGPGSVVGSELLENPDVAKIAFTGETATGREIMRGASSLIKRITLELGGSDPMIVCDDADLDLAVEGALWGRFRNAGQSCTSVKRLFLFDKIAQRFLDAFTERTREIKVGNGLQPGVMMGPLNNAAQRRSVERMVGDALERGAHLLTGGKRPNGRLYQNGHFYMPTVLTNVEPSSSIVEEECFGPALPVFTVDNLEEAINMANRSVYGLGSSIWTRDIAKARLAAERLETGTTWINSPPIARPEVPFGGFKQSGFGRELGMEGLEHYFEVKSIQTDISGKQKMWKYPI